MGLNRHSPLFQTPEILPIEDQLLRLAAGVEGVGFPDIISGYKLHRGKPKTLKPRQSDIQELSAAIVKGYESRSGWKRIRLIEAADKRRDIHNAPFAL